MTIIITPKDQESHQNLIQSQLRRKMTITLTTTTLLGSITVRLPVRRSETCNLSISVIVWFQVPKLVSSNSKGFYVGTPSRYSNPGPDDPESTILTTRTRTPQYGQEKLQTDRNGKIWRRVLKPVEGGSLGTRNKCEYKFSVGHL